MTERLRAWVLGQYRQRPGLDNLDDDTLWGAFSTLMFVALAGTAMGFVLGLLTFALVAVSLR